MRISVSAVLAVSIIILLLVAGCADVSTSQKVGDFGTAFGATEEEQKAIDWFKATYGDPTSNNGDAPRFIEPLITSGISDKKLPVDKVKEFPVAGGSVYFFVIYDNFEKGDPITVSWTYLENDRVVTTVNQNAGGDFGRFIVEFQKPDSGWGKGGQKITVSGGDATADAEFIIGDKLVTVPLPYNPVTGTETPVTTKTTTVKPTGTMTIPATTFTTAATVQPTTAAEDCPWGVSCNGICVNTAEDDNNCGGCMLACSDEYGPGSHCYRGHCEDPCPAGLHSCGSGLGSYEWCAIDLTSDPLHCGSCEITCSRGAAGNATPTCYMSQCI